MPLVVLLRGFNVGGHRTFGPKALAGKLRHLDAVVSSVGAQLVAREGRFVFGVYRRHLKVIRYLGTLDRTFGVPGTTRNWNTVTAIAEAVGG